MYIHTYKSVRPSVAGIFTYIFSLGWFFLWSGVFKKALVYAVYKLMMWYHTLTCIEKNVAASPHVLHFIHLRFIFRHFVTSKNIKKFQFHNTKVNLRFCFRFNYILYFFFFRDAFGSKSLRIDYISRSAIVSLAALISLSINRKTEPCELIHIILLLPQRPQKFASIFFVTAT